MHETQPKDLIIFTGEKIQNHIHTLGIAEKIKRIREETDIVMIGDYDWQNYDKVNRDLFMKKPFTIKDFKGRILNLLLQRNDFNPLEKLKIRL